jgi:phospholipid-binding lipoprotein MlaA
MRATRGNAAILSVLAALAGCATPPSANSPEPNDPFESSNRAVFKANDAVDRAVIKPVAKGYQSALPQWVRDRFRHFLDNLTEPRVFTHAFLQVRINAVGTTFTRFLVNSTAGVFGLFDVATDLNLPRQTGDLGQTLARWGVGEGPYVVLPFFGPSNVRDAVGLTGDLFTDFYINPAGVLVTGTPPAGWNIGQGVTSGVDLRARNIDTVDSLQASSLDNYAQMRSISRQHRMAEVREAKGLPNEPEELVDPGAAPTNTGVASTNHLEAASHCAVASCQ